MTPTEGVTCTTDDTIQAWRQRIGTLDPRQIAAWRAMRPALSPGALAWRVTRRMQGDRSLGREYD
jgi:hypothetical protein